MSAKGSILIIDDEQEIRESLEQVLKLEGYRPASASTAEEGLQKAEEELFDLVLLDVSLPGMDGMSVARKLREHRNQTPVLMLTARDAAADIVTGLDSGADDYLTKPFSIDVLLARLRAVSRRGSIPKPMCLQVADVVLDPARHRVTRNGDPLNLTPREYKLLELLMRNPGRAISRDTILESVWGFGTEVSENTVEVFMRHLRLKMDTGEPKLIHTVRGFGYMLREP